MDFKIIFFKTFWVLSFFIIHLTQIINTEKTDTITFESLVEKYTSYKNTSEFLSKNERAIEIYELLNLIKKVKKSSSNAHSIDSLHYNLILDELIDKIHLNDGNLDSLRHYASSVIENSKSSFFLGRAYDLEAYLNTVKNEKVKALEMFDKALNAYNLSQNPEKYHRKILTQLNLAKFYLDNQVPNYSDEMLKTVLKDIEFNSDTLNYYPQKTFYNLLKLRQLKQSNKIAESLNLITSINEDKIVELVDLFNFYKECRDIYFNNNDVEIAVAYHNKIYKSSKFKKFLNQEARIDDYVFQIKISLLEKNYKNTFFYLEKIKEDYNQSNIKDNHLNNYYAEYYNAIGNYKKGNAYLRRYYQTKDSLNQINSQLFFNFANRKNNTAQKAIFLAAQNKENTLELLTDSKNYLLIAGLIIIILLLIIFQFYNTKKEKRQKQEEDLSNAKNLLDFKNRLFENILHEIKNPITIVIGFLSLVKENTLEPVKVQNYTDKALKNSTEMVAVLDNLLAVQKKENTNTINSEITNNQLDLFLREIINTFLGNCELKNIKLYYKTNILSSLSIDFNFKSLGLIVANLVSNAIKFSPSNTSIYVNITLTDNHLQIRIKDEGIGISKAEKEEVFSRFYQSQNNKSTGGFGIGLSLVADHVKLLKGKITLESELNVGSIFYIEIPLVVENYKIYTKDLKINYELQNEEITAENNDKNKPRILIVEDNIELINFLKELFSDYLNCTFAYNGAEGLTIAKQQQFDLIISDYQMPIMTGIEFKMEINQLNNYHNVPFILLSSVAYDQITELQSDIGIDHYITKPFNKNEILSKVTGLLDNIMFKKGILKTDETIIDYDFSHSDLMIKISGIILDNLTNNSFNANTLAQSCGYTQRNLNKLLKSKTGLTINNIVLEVRLQNAYDLIVKKQYNSLNAVMDECGFNSRTYFYKKFENRFGIKPGELKKKYSFNN